MGKVLSIIAVAFLLAACGPGQYTVKNQTDAFDADGLERWVAENNRISSKSIAGGIHIDDEGVYMDPFSVRESRTGEIQASGLILTNRTSYSTNMGRPNSLGQILEVTFLIDGTPLRADIANSDSEWGSRTFYNNLTRSASVDIQENATLILSADQLRSIGNANQLAVKIVGARQSVIYESTDISAEFQSAIQQFTRQYL